MIFVRAENNLPPAHFRFDCPATSERIRLACGDAILQKAQQGKIKGKEGEKPWFVTA
jgi:hypothetical protein